MEGRIFMKYSVKIFLSVVLGVYFYASGQTQTISGRVIDSVTSTPISNATVSLKAKALTTYTDTLGRFSLTFTTTLAGRAAESGRPALLFNGSIMSFSTGAGEKVVVDIYDIRGRKISTLLDRTFGAGTYAFSVPALMRQNAGSGIYLVKIRKGNDRFTATLLSMGAKTGISVDKSSVYSVNGGAIFGITASLDSLPAYRMGYITKALPIASYATQNVGDIALVRTAEEIAVAKKVDSLLALMSLAEKAGQMTQVQVNNYDGNAANHLTDAQVASYGIGSVFNGSSNDGSASGNTPAAWAALIDRPRTS